MKILWGKISDFFNKKYVKPISIVLVIIFITPIIVSILMECSFMDFGSQKAESWMSFWGGYLGAILGIVGAITVTTLQISSQTDQIVLAAKENDKLERARIELNLKIEKNVELFKYFVDLKREIIQYEHTLKYLINEQKSLLDNFNRVAKANSKEILGRFGPSESVKAENKKSLERIDQEYNSNVEKVETLKNELRQKISHIKSLVANIFANIIFINEREAYFEALKKYLDIVQKELDEVEKYLLAGEMNFLDNEKIQKRSYYLNKKIVEIAEMETETSEQYSNFIKNLVSNIGQKK